MSETLDLAPNNTTEIAWGKKTEYVEKYAVEALEALNATDYEKSKSALEIYQKAKEKHPDISFPNTGLPETTFRAILSHLVQKSDSRITKREGKHGYFLSTFLTEKVATPAFDETTDTSTESSSGRKYSQRERLLYPLLKQWLSDQSYKVSSHIFNKKGNETWGNPDIAGIRVEEHLTRLDIEIVTIEAKISKDQWGCNWRKDIFEAVSHKRYANRAYFCFAIRFGDKIADLSDIRYYCEQYRIGLILIEIHPSLIGKLDYVDSQSSDFTEEEKDFITITEKFPAPFDLVSLKYQRAFCENTLGIMNMTDLFNYGSE